MVHLGKPDLLRVRSNTLSNDVVAYTLVPFYTIYNAAAHTHTTYKLFALPR